MSGAALSALIAGIEAAIIGLIWLLLGFFGRGRHRPIRCRHCREVIELEQPIAGGKMIWGWQHQATGELGCEQSLGSWLAEP